MQYIEKLNKGHFYHIFNRGINSCKIFNESENFAHFYQLYEKYIPKVAETYAWVLIPNHFHFMVYVKKKPAKIIKNGKLTELSASQQFSNLFNSYAQAFNKQYNRHGGLFERPFSRKLILDTVNLKNVLLYIHQNPIHHRICKHPLEYGWSSYIRYTSSNLPNSCSFSAIELFKNKKVFFESHRGIIPPGIIEDEPIISNVDINDPVSGNYSTEIFPDMNFSKSKS